MSSARVLAETLWFPVTLFLGFLFCFAPALHAPQPHHAHVVVAGHAPEAKAGAALHRHFPGAFDVTSVADKRAAREAVLDRSAVAGYVAGSRPVLYVAKANGMSLLQALSKDFAGLTSAKSEPLTVKDVAPTATRDLTGTTLVYFGTAWNIPGYLLATTLLRAVTFNRRGKLLTIFGVATVFAVVGDLVGVGLGYLPNDPAALGMAFLLTTAVATFCTGMAPFTKQFFPGVGMGLFIVLSTPTSGVAPVPMLPAFFQHVHAVMPLGNAVDALRGVLYFHGAGVLRPVLVLCAWIAGGVGLMGFDAWRHRGTAAARHSGRARRDKDVEPPVDDPSVEILTPTAMPAHHHFGEPLPTLTGTVRDSARQPLPHAALTVMDGRGRQLVRTATDDRGTYAVAGLPEGHLTIVASSRSRKPQVQRRLLEPGTVLRADFTLGDRTDEAPSPTLCQYDGRTPNRTAPDPALPAGTDGWSPRGLRR
ncbi:carboxypeptidase regulatory-like domain-containing protein [Streptomyces sp. NPDC007157]|uniref:carboxypeptidase regulatory-like domain-containing protein n=1 Tax=Streptomyces sp. NPDC007157 TaxID=3154681 RepID=UPI0033C649D3